MRCSNRPTGVPTSGCCDCSQRRDRIAQQLAGLLGQLRQHGGQVDGQLPEQVQPDGADLLEPLGLFGAAEVPGGVVLDELVGPLAGGQDQPHGPGEIAGLVGRGDGLAVGGGLGEQAAVVGIFGRQARLLGELGRAAGQVDHLAHHVGIDLGDELVEVQVEVVHAATSASRRNSIADRPGRDAPGTSRRG